MGAVTRDVTTAGTTGAVDAAPVRERGQAGEVVYDPFSTETHEDPYSTYAYLRAYAPVYYNEVRDLWAVSRYEDVCTVSRDWRSFTCSEGVDTDNTALMFGPGNMLDTDPPLHDLLRAVIKRDFVPRVLREALEAPIRVEVERLVTRMKMEGVADAAQDLAWELPPFVVCRLLGLDDDHRPRLRRWLQDLMKRTAGRPEPPQAAVRVAAELKRYLLEEICSRLRTPRDDLLTTIAKAKVDGEPIGDMALGLTALLVVAAGETTAALLSNALYLLAKHPEQRAQLAADPGMIPNAVEEVLRFESPVQNLKRTATRDVELRGVTIPRGAQVLLLYGSANRDERYFSRPERFDVGRSAKRHLAFGDGIHHCLGAPLARLEGKIVLEVVLAEAPGYELMEGAARFPSHMARGFEHLPVRMGAPSVRTRPRD
jgi:cytochrome P450